MNGDEPESETSAALDEYSAALRDAIVAAMPAWVSGHVVRLAEAWFGSADAAVHAAAAAAGHQAANDVERRLAELLTQDVDAQRTTPLAVVRGAVSYPTAVLADAGVPEVQRDEFTERAFPADVYDLTPGSWREVSEDVHDAGLAWGAWKAHQHLTRRRNAE